MLTAPATRAQVAGDRRARTPAPVRGGPPGRRRRLSAPAPARLLAAIGLSVAAALIPVRSAVAQVTPADPSAWRHVGGDAGGSRYSAADQITPANVGGLEVAWTYRTGDLIEGRTRFQATPLLVDGTLYLSTPFGRVVALDPARGTERWSFDPRIDPDAPYGDFANRGVAYWDTAGEPGAAGGGGAGAAAGVQGGAAPSGSDPAPPPCARRVFVAPIDARLIALDAGSGRPCADFGEGGTVHLDRDVGSTPRRAEYQVTSPPMVVGDRVVVGSAIADNQRLDAPSGKVRAYDVRTGALAWSFDAVPRDRAGARERGWEGERALETGAANVWAVMSADPARDLLFVPTGSPSPDFFGGERLGDNRWANSLVALRASTGEVVWAFQAVHHDVWDYDLPAQPILATVVRDGREVPIVVQLTKTGYVFVLDRETGEPVFGAPEVAVPASDVPGEVTSPTQPRPLLPAPLAPSGFTAADAWGPTPADRDGCRAALAGLRSEGIFTPPSLAGSILFPGNVGGSNWSGGAVHPGQRILVAPTNRIATVVRLIPRAELQATAGSLRQDGWEVATQAGTAYGMARWFPLSPAGLPCNPPPWGTLAAVDLDSGERLWEVPVGAFPGFEDVPAAADWGSLVFGGPVVTATGVVFMAGTADPALRAFDLASGRLLWTGRLPASGNATPMTYEVDGRQYVVVAAGGHGRIPSVQGDHVVAFALPR